MEKEYDVIVVGAGAAGLMTAIECRRRGFETLILDGKQKIGAKILMSGGTRCNVTNRIVSEKDYESESIRFVRNVLRAFPPGKTIRFFQEMGVDFVLEEGGKYFPTTHSGRTILEALMRGLKACGAELLPGHKVTEVLKREESFLVNGPHFLFSAKAVVLCTGGLSYPATGSDGTGYRLAAAFGHPLVPTSPSLTPLKTGDENWKGLSGVSLPCRLTLYVSGKKHVSYEGPFLFTHFGFSGPVVLNMSRHWIRLKDQGPVRLEANFLPSYREDSFRDEFLHHVRRHPRRSLGRFLSSLLPERFAQVFLKKTGLRESSPLSEVKAEEREKMIRALLHFPLPVSGDKGYEKAEVTAGGVDLRDVDFKTMRSRLQPGLFFAGEILDADGRIGGFNFQWAWSSAFAAAEGVCAYLLARS